MVAASSLTLFATANQVNATATNRQKQAGVISVNYSGLGKVALLDSNGHYTGQYVNKNSRWKIFEKADINGRTMYRLGTDKQWIPAQYASFYTPTRAYHTNTNISSNYGMRSSRLLGQGSDVTKPLWDKPIKVPDGTIISGKTNKIAHSVTPTYIIGPTGKRYDLPVGNADGIAQTIAKAINESGLKLTDKQRVGLAAGYVSMFTTFSNYTMSGPYYAKPYGLFVKHEYSCAGTARALGLVLGYMGYHWQHVNPNAYKHQWVQVQMDGKTGWADGETGYVGYGNNWGDDNTWYY